MYSVRKAICSVMLSSILIATMIPQRVEASETHRISYDQNTSTEDLLLEDLVNLEVRFFGNDNYESVTQNVYLPTTGKMGSNITWISSDTNVISNAGVVTRPKTEDKYVTLTAVLTKGDKLETRSFDLLVLKQVINIPQVSITESYTVTKGDKVNLQGYVYADSLISSVVVDISDQTFSSSKITINPMDYVYDLSKISLDTTDKAIVGGKTYSIRIWVKTQNYQEDKVVATAKLTVLPRESSYEIVNGPQRDIYYFNQGDKNYKDYSYAGLTLGENGTGPTAMAMVISSLKDQVVDPITMANWSVEKNLYTNYNGATNAFIQASANAYNLSVESLNFNYSNDALTKKITQALKEGKLVVALLKSISSPTFGQTKDKFIVLRGINEDGKVLIADPADDSYRSRTKRTDGYDIQTVLRECKTSTDGGGPLWIISSKEALPRVTGLQAAYTLTVAGKLTLPGIVTGQTDLTNVTLVISNVNNGKVTGEELRYVAYPNNKNYDLRNIGLNTSNLKVGTYKIRIFATTLGDIRNHSMIYDAQLSVIDKTDQIIVQDTNKLNIGYAAGDSASYVTTHITLPSKGEGGSSIVWSSSNSNVIQVTNNGVGIVYRPTANTNVTLTATLRYGNMSKTKTFQVTVIGLKNTTVSGLKSTYEVYKGEKVTLSGLIQSSSLLAKVRVTIDGYDYFSVEKWPNSYSYDLSNISFPTQSWTLNLQPGTYTIEIYATNANSSEGSTPIATTKLKVKSKEWKKAWWDKKNIKLFYAKGDSWKKITKNITLPSKGWYGSKITWESMNESIISDTGVVNRPKTKDEKVTLVATITLGDVTITREIVVTVKANNSKNKKGHKGR